jgi:P4 family phage/plasmid primase-like protien
MTKGIQDFAQLRGFDITMMRKFGCEVEGLCIKIPMRNLSGIIGYSCRHLDNTPFPPDKKSRTPKAKTLSGENGLFRIPDLPPKGAELWLVEGAPDTLALLTAGVDAIGTSAAEPKPEELDDLSDTVSLIQPARVILCPQTGKGAAAWQKKIGWALANLGIDLLIIPGKYITQGGDPWDRAAGKTPKDIDDFLRGAADKAKALKSLRERAQEFVISPEPKSKKVKGSLREFFENRHFSPVKLCRFILTKDKIVLRFDSRSQGGVLMRWTSGVWKPARAYVREAMHRALGELSQRRYLDDALSIFECEVEKIPIERWDACADYINCRNGLVNIRTLELTPHDPSLYQTCQIPWDYNPKAQDDRLDAALSAIMADPKTLDVLLTMMGYILISAAPAKKIFFLLGERDTGKTTVCCWLQGLVGRELVSKIPLESLLENRFAQSGLESRLVNLPDELRCLSIEDVEHLKALTGADSDFLVERKNQNAYNARMTCKLVFCANRLPYIATVDEAFLNRLVILPFEHQFSSEEINPKVRDEFPKDEKIMTALFAKATAYLPALIENRWQFPQSDKTAECKEQFAAQVAPDDIFVKTRCELLRGSEAQTSRENLWESFRAWCRQREVTLPTPNKFYRKLRQRYGCQDGFSKDEFGDSVRVMRGIKLLPEEAESKPEKCEVRQGEFLGD